MISGYSELVPRVPNWKLRVCAAQVGALLSKEMEWRRPVSVLKELINHAVRAVCTNDRE